MGLASSQARLLSLTSRQHSVERNAQFLQAQKLRLANDSDTVYKNYMNALDATLLQTRQYNSDGKATWIDGSLNNLMRYGASSNTTGNTYYVQNIADGKLYMPQTVTERYNQAITTPNVDDQVYKFLGLNNIKYTKNTETNQDRIAQLAVVAADENAGYNYDSAFVAQIEEYTRLKGLTTLPVETNTYTQAQNLYTVVNLGKLDNSTYVYGCDSYLDSLKADLTNLKDTSYYTGDTKTLIDYCLNIDNNVSSNVIANENNGTVAWMSDNTSYDLSKLNITANNGNTYIQYLSDFTDNPMFKSETTNNTTAYTTTVTTNNSKSAVSADTPILASTASDNSILGSTYSRTYYTLTDAAKMSILLTGGSYSATYTKKQGLKTDTATTKSNTIYSSDTQALINRITGNTSTETSKASSIGDALLQIANNIKEAENNVAVTEAKKNLSDYIATLKKPGTSTTMDAASMATYAENHKKYVDDVNKLADYPEIIGTVYDDKIQGKYYENLFNAIKAAGGCTAISETNEKSSSWVNNMIKNGQVILATYNSETGDIDNTSASANTGLQEINDDTQITIADNNYETDLADIKAKEKNYDTKLNQLETEKSAIETEMDTLKTIIKDNTESTFKLFS